MTRLIDRVRAAARNRAFEKFVRTEPRAGLIRLGSNYGGWWLPDDLVVADSVVYSAGLGEDASFDLALIERYGCTVWSMDPTPRSITHAETIDNPRFRFLPVGIWSENTVLRFYAPQNPEHVSHSVVNAQRTRTYFEAECKTLRTLVGELGHDRIDLLKMNIEGAETAVLVDMLAMGPLPRVLLVAFESPDGIIKDLRRVRDLAARGFTPVNVQRHSVTFVRQGD